MNAGVKWGGITNAQVYKLWIGNGIARSTRLLMLPCGFLARSTSSVIDCLERLQADDSGRTMRRGGEHDTIHGGASFPDQLGGFLHIVSRNIPNAS